MNYYFIIFKYGELFYLFVQHDKEKIINFFVD